MDQAPKLDFTGISPCSSSSASPLSSTSGRLKCLSTYERPRILIIGNEAVGKSTFVRTLLDFPNKWRIGDTITENVFVYNNPELTCEVSENNGHREYVALGETHMRNSHAIILMVEINSTTKTAEIQSYLSKIVSCHPNTNDSQGTYKRSAVDISRTAIYNKSMDQKNIVLPIPVVVVVNKIDTWNDDERRASDLLINHIRTAVVVPYQFCVLKEVSPGCTQPVAASVSVFGCSGEKNTNVVPAAECLIKHMHDSLKLEDYIAENCSKKPTGRTSLISALLPSCVSQSSEK